MRGKTCCFTGHREVDENVLYLKRRLKKQLEYLIKRGVIYFGAGGARGFDTVAAQTVVELKQQYPQIRLILVLPCIDQTRGWNTADIKKYKKIKEKADKIRVLSENYVSGCMHVRNRHLVDCSSVCVCYKRKEVGGTAYTVNYARSKGLEIIEL